ncbi:MAG: helix-turn-helix transcriptional regulator [Ruminococcaceae bacterium]|nr:helix-turn-helix transcriptional regulator [Oscillospiraceae bacterium]
MLPIAEIIRNKRREKNVTQDELAQALGVTFQSVSRWENGVAYPDIELIPKIALYFEITTDELLGANEEARKEAQEKRWHEVFNSFCYAKSSKEKFDIALKAYREFGDTFYATRACELIVGENLMPRADGLLTLRKLATEVLNNPGSIYDQTSVIETVYKYEDENKLSNWNKYVADEHAVRKLLARRYAYKNDIDNMNRQLQINRWYSLNHSFDSEFAKRHSEWYFDPFASVNGQKTILRLVDALRDPSVEVDAWIRRRAFTYIRLAAAYFGVGMVDPESFDDVREKGYEALSKGVELYETIFKIPVEQELSFNHPVFDLISVSVSSLFCPDGLYNKSNIYTVYQNAIAALTSPTGWAWFDDVRNEERFKSYIARIEKYKPEGYDEYFKD